MQHGNGNGNGNAAVAPPTGRWPVLPGLDTATGLAQVGGSKTFYRRMLVLFARTCGEDVPTLTQALAAADGAAVARIAHRVKGSASTIGATTIAGLAAALETAATSPCLSSPTRPSAGADPVSGAARPLLAAMASTTDGLLEWIAATASP